MLLCNHRRGKTKAPDDLQKNSFIILHTFLQNVFTPAVGFDRSEAGVMRLLYFGLSPLICLFVRLFQNKLFCVFFHERASPDKALDKVTTDFTQRIELVVLFDTF